MMDIDSETDDSEELQEKLREILNQEGIIGYILKYKKSASIDLKDPTKIIDYATLLSVTSEIGQSMSEALNIGEAETIILESEETKLLSMNSNDNNISIFMEKAVNHEKLIENLK